MATTDLAPDVSQHLQILNPAPGLPETFHFFSRLPPDIRYLVWQKALNYERLLRISLHTVNKPDRESNPEGKSYRIVLDQPQPISKLFRTTTESRYAARNFYRVQLPCSYSWYGRYENQGTLYLCPELDILEIDYCHYLEQSPEHFASLAHDIWVGDPQHIGLLNVSLPAGFDRRCENLRLAKQSESLLLKQVVSRLKRVIFFQRQKVHRYPITSLFPGVPTYDLHRCVPITTSVSRFDWLQKDPRPIADELRNTKMGSLDPRIGVYAWARMLSKLGLQYDKLNIAYSFLLSYDDDSSTKIGSRRVVESLVREEFSQRKVILQERRQIFKEQARDETLEELSATPQLAVGFWLFPLESIGPFPDLNTAVDQEKIKYVPYRVLDLSAYLPELCLSHLQ